VITDVTRGIEDSQKLEPTRLDLKLYDSVVDAEAAAANVPTGKGGKKK
jgi:hypothetical protein